MSKPDIPLPKPNRSALLGVVPEQGTDSEDNHSSTGQLQPESEARAEFAARLWHTLGGILMLLLLTTGAVALHNALDWAKTNGVAPWKITAIDIAESFLLLVDLAGIIFFTCLSVVDLIVDTWRRVRIRIRPRTQP